MYVCSTDDVNADSEKTHWYSRTWFADRWHAVTVINPMVTNMASNGGLLVALFCWTRLKQDDRSRADTASGAKKRS